MHQIESPIIYIPDPKLPVLREKQGRSPEIQLSENFYFVSQTAILSLSEDGPEDVAVYQAMRLDEPLHLAGVKKSVLTWNGVDKPEYFDGWMNFIDEVPKTQPEGSLIVRRVFSKAAGMVVEPEWYALDPQQISYQPLFRAEAWIREGAIVDYDPDNVIPLTADISIARARLKRWNDPHQSEEHEKDLQIA